MSPGVDTRHAWATYVDGSEESLDRLLEHYRGVHRAYHDLSHIDAVTRNVASLAAVARDGSSLDLGTVMAAALYHDVIYDPTAPGNEEASAEYAITDLSTLGWDSGRMANVSQMIIGTAGHRDPADRASAILNDADLAILGASAAHYERYAQQVRREYGHVTDEAWRVGRAQVLESYLDRTSLYATPEGVSRWDAQARANLSTELSALA